MPFATKAALGFFLVIAITICLVIQSYIATSRTSAERTNMLSEYSDDLFLASTTQAAADEMVAAGRGYLLTGENSLLSKVASAQKRLDWGLQQLARRAHLPGEQALAEAAGNSAATYARLLRDLLDSAARMSRPEVTATLEDSILPARDRLSHDLEALTAKKRTLQNEGRARARDLLSQELRRLVILGLSGITISLVLAGLFSAQLLGLYRREQKATQLARQATAAREDLLAIVAHDLRGPLQSMLLKAYLIEKYPDAEQNRELASSLTRVVSTMDKLIDALLDSASIEAGRFVVAHDRCVVAHILRDAAEIFVPLAVGREIDLTLEVEPPDVAVWGDPIRLLQLLGNLISNALKFTPAAGRIEVRVAPRGTWVRFEVQDTGPGIRAEQLPHIFDRYWKDNALQSGAGLGLYIAKGIAEAHGGSIGVEASVGEGSRFFFDIPCCSGGSPQSLMFPHGLRRVGVESGRC